MTGNSNFSNCLERYALPVSERRRVPSCSSGPEAERWQLAKEKTVFGCIDVLVTCDADVVSNKKNSSSKGWYTHYGTGDDPRG